MPVLNGISGGIIALIIVGVLLLILVIWWISTSNSLNKMIVKIDEAESGIDIALTKRFDLLTKALAATKGYAKHEAETLEKVTAMRAPLSNATIAEKSEFASATLQAMRSINLVAENYPQLKASETFTRLQLQISDVEEQLQAARRVYNSNVSIYNQKVVVFPSSMVASIKKINKREFFEAEETKREDVKIEF